MKLIIDTDAALAKLSLPQLPEIIEAVDAALITAHTHLQAVYDSTFEYYASLKDVFNPDSTWYPLLVGGLFRLRLKKAFIHSGTVSLEWADNFKFTDAETIPEEDYYLDLDKGKVFLEYEEYDRKFIRVTYSCGFDSTHKAPEWLKEACLTLVTGMLQTNSVNGQDVTILTKAREDAIAVAGSLIEPYMRGAALQYRPIM